MNNLKVSTKFYLTGLFVIVVLPIVLILLYERLAGGVFNGMAGSWKQAKVDPNIFLLFVNPILLLLGYGVLMNLFLKHKAERKGALSTIVAYVVLIVATIVVFAGIFWKLLTT